MEHIQTDVSDEELITAIRANMSDLFRHMGRSMPENFFENEKFARWYTPVQHPWFNGVVSSGPFEEMDDAFIRGTIQFFRDNQIRTFTWWMEPPLRPSDLEPVLSKHGFGFDNGTPGMAVDLQALNEPIETVDGLEIHVVENEKTLRAWTNVFINGYGLPSAWESATFELWKQMGFDLPLRNYIGYLNGKPVSTSTLFNGGGAAGIWSVSTLREARGRGIGAALTLKPLQDARAMGYRIGVLQSSEMGFNIYKKLGFRHLCQIENFYLSIK